MSTLKVNRIEPRTGDTVEIVGLDIPEPTGGHIKAWVNFDATIGDVAINESFNVSSVTEVSQGRYLVNFENEMPDVNYSFAVNGSIYDDSPTDLANTPQAFVGRLKSTYKTNSIEIGATVKGVSSLNVFNGLGLISLIVCR